MGEALFEFLFKYRPLVYDRGELAFGLPAPWLVALAGAVAALAVVTYLFARGRARTRDRVLLSVIRTAILTVVLFLLARPVLLISTVVPQQNYLAVLVDDSRSMRIDDGVSRAAVINDAFLDPGSGLREALASRFRLRVYRFSEVVDRLGDDEVPEFAGSRTRLGRALDHVRDQLSSLPLSGVVVATDGADHEPAALDEALLGFKAAALPVFAVGVGSEAFGRDVEVTRVSAPRTALSGSATVADVVLGHSGMEGETVPLVVERDGRIVGTRDVRLGPDGSTTVRVDFDAEEAGTGTYRFRVPAQEGELVDRNNERDLLVQVRDGPQKVLYFEGEPRHEVAFLRRAVADDPAIQLVVLQRTDRERYLRLAVDSADELADGFPRTREALFEYRALVLGSVEASHFTHDQLSMMEEFVERRGGGLLVLGGRSALAEGGWSDTPVAAALPVRRGPRSAASLFLAEPQVSPPTRMAAGAPVTAWTDLPPLTVFNRVGPAKPGATTLLRGRGDAIPDGQPVLAIQRYGAGRTAVFAVQDSWLWRMHADIPVEDETHERLWRQLLRWLTAETPDRVAAEVPPEPVGPGQSVEIRGAIRDARFGGVNGADVRATVTAPSGATREVPLQWAVTGDGEYRGSFVADEVGFHSVAVTARQDTAELTAAPVPVRVAPSTEEYFGAHMRRGTLERVAEETGGRFYSAADVANLPEDIAYTARGVTVVEELELWDAPAGFLLLLTLLTVEWAYRRRRGLA
jgi:uncharacterized membrane protein